jgi:hypothetical protein
LNTETDPSDPSFTVTRFGTGPGPTLFRLDASGRAAPVGQTVTKPGPVAST